jgi:hypothetical protein
MYEIIMVIDNTEYKYGFDSNRDKANEIALKVQAERNVETYVREA